MIFKFEIKDLNANHIFMNLQFSKYIFTELVEFIVSF